MGATKTENRQGALRRFSGAGFETALVFALFFLYGAYPVPDVNEQYYVGKAIHFWNPDYFPSDKFLDTPDSHWFFCATFGAFSKFLPPTALVWFGRVLVWLGAAAGWRRLSNALLPYRFASVATAALFLFLLEYFHLAGEWVAGGVEGKGFAFPFVFFGLAALVRRRWNRAFILLGVASAFHVLVGGWAVVAALAAAVVTWLGGRRRKIAFAAFFPGLVLGGSVALLGLIPALALDRGVAPEVVRQAHQIYVFERLSHHLVASSLPWTFLLRFGLLSAIWILFCRFRPNDEIDANDLADSDGAADSLSSRWSVWNRFVAAAFGIALVGLGVDYGSLAAVRLGWAADRLWSAELLRFYFFRLSDWAIPAGAALGSVAAVAECLAAKEPSDSVSAQRFSVRWFAAACIAAVALFYPIKLGFRALAERAAAAATVDGAWPAIPKSTDGVAFLTAIGLIGLLGYAVGRKSAFSRRFIGAALLAAALFGVAATLHTKTEPMVPRSAPPKESIAAGWLDICRWAKENTPPDAVFLVPRGCDSLKWNAGRAVVGSWKEVPQDAASLVDWYRRMENLYTPLGDKKSPTRWNQPLCAILINKGRGRFEKLAGRYGFDYIVSELPPYQLASFPKAMARYEEFAESEVYRNGQFVVFQIERKPEE